MRHAAKEKQQTRTRQKRREQRHAWWQRKVRARARLCCRFRLCFCCAAMFLLTLRAFVFVLSRLRFVVF